MSVNDVNRILYDYRHGSGAYNQQINSMYNYFVNSTTSYSNSFGVLQVVLHIQLRRVIHLTIQMVIIIRQV